MQNTKTRTMNNDTLDLIEAASHALITAMQEHGGDSDVYKMALSIYKNASQMMEML